MRTEIKYEHKSDCVRYEYFCARCKQPCGDSEVKGNFDVREVKIETVSGVRRELVIDPEVHLVVHETKKVRLIFKEGSNYPEGGMVTAQVIDCCSTCWTEAVLPALALLGFEMREEDRSW